MKIFLVCLIIISTNVNASQGAFDLCRIPAELAPENSSKDSGRVKLTAIKAWQNMCLTLSSYSDAKVKLYATTSCYSQAFQLRTPKQNWCYNLLH